MNTKTRLVATVDSNLYAEVDRLCNATQETTNRSAAVEEALRMWVRATQEELDAVTPVMLPELDISNRASLPWIHQSWQEAISKHRRLLVEVPRMHGCTTQLLARYLEEGPDRCALVRGETWRKVQSWTRRYGVFGQQIFSADAGPPPDNRYDLVLVDNALHPATSVDALDQWLSSVSPDGHVAIFYHDHDIGPKANAAWIESLGQRDDWTWLRYGYYSEEDRLYGYCDNVLSGSVYDCPDGVHWPEYWSRDQLDQTRKNSGETSFGKLFNLRP